MSKEILVEISAIIHKEIFEGPPEENAEEISKGIPKRIARNVNPDARRSKKYNTTKNLSCRTQRELNAA